jgi:hypothetical protein
MLATMLLNVDLLTNQQRLAFEPLPAPPASTVIILLDHTLCCPHTVLP